MSGADTPDVFVADWEAGGWRATLGQHALVALALGAIGLAFFAASRVGNNLGIDDWMHFYYVYYLRSLHFADRPLSLILLGALQPLAGTDYLVYHIAMLAVRIASAWFIYLSVRYLAPDDPLFAFACGALFLTFFVYDLYLLLTPIYITNSVASLFLTLAALAAHFIVMQGKRPHVVWFLLLTLSIALAYVSPLVREDGIPLLVGIPTLVFLAQRDFHWRRVIGLAIWLTAVLLGGRMSILSVLGLGGQTYARGLYTGLNLGALLVASFKQFHFAFYDLIFSTWEWWYPYRLFALVNTSLVLISLNGFARLNGWREPAEMRWPRTQRYLLFVAGGFAATWLGFAAYLPTMFAMDTSNAHILAMAGEAVLLASLIWLAGSLFRQGNHRQIIRALGLVYVVFCGTASIGRTQHQITEELAGSWENTAYFMRSLAHLVPDVNEPTLFVYIEDPDLPEAPFTSGFSFQYAVRYFYDNQATGLIPTDNILGSWSVSDEGIMMSEAWIPGGAELFPWECVIFFKREHSGRLFILDEPPADFAPEAARARYDPHRLIARAYIPTRVQETFPILVDMPGWEEAVQARLNR